MSDWDSEASDKEETAKAAAPSQGKVVQKKSKWEGEDEDDDGPAVAIGKSLQKKRRNRPHLRL